MASKTRHAAELDVRWIYLTTNPEREIRWKLGVLAGLAIVAITFIPEVAHWVHRGSDWNGTYACVDPDEMAYSAYLASIIKGGPRRNNPYLSSTQHPEAAEKENLFSIQFVPPFALGFLARTIGVSASTTFILLIPIFAFVSSIAVFWLLSALTDNDIVSAVGTLIVLLCGVVVSENLFAADQPYYTFAFLRRYIPAVPFPVFFLFCVFVWRALTSNTPAVWAWSCFAGVSFCFLVFSYFYLWTAAAAWLALLAVIWMLIRPFEWKQLLKPTLTVAGMAAVALLAYFHLVSRRADTMDDTHILILTHSPDLLRFSEIVSLILLIVLAVYLRRGRIASKSPTFIFAISFTLTPFVVFNQQVVTGRSLQPFHYEQFIVNYLVLVAAVVIYYLVRKAAPKWPVIVSAVALGVGLSVAFASSAVTATINERRDEAIAIYEVVKDRSAPSGKVGLTLFDQPLLSVDAPTSYDIPVLWSPYMYTFGTTTAEEAVERFFQYLYYLGVDGSQFEAELREERVYQATLFGLHRVNKKLSSHFQPITEEEIQVQSKAYFTYIRGFSREHASRWPLSFVVLEDKRTYDLSNLDRWYEREIGHRTGSAIVYRVKIRTGLNQSALRIRTRKTSWNDLEFVQLMNRAALYYSCTLFLQFFDM